MQALPDSEGGALDDQAADEAAEAEEGEEEEGEDQSPCLKIFVGEVLERSLMALLDEGLEDLTGVGEDPARAAAGRGAC